MYLTWRRRKRSGRRRRRRRGRGGGGGGGGRWLIRGSIAVLSTKIKGTIMNKGKLLLILEEVRVRGNTLPNTEGDKNERRYVNYLLKGIRVRGKIINLSN